MLKYVEGKSRLHLLDSRIKFLGLLSLLALAFASPLGFSPLLFSLVVLLYLIAGIGFRQIRSELKLMVAVSFFTILFRFFFEQGKTSIFGFSMPLWLHSGALNLLYLFTVFFLSMLFVYTTRVYDFRQALIYFRLPRNLVFALGISLQSVPLLQSRFKRVRVAQASRGSKRSIFSLVLPPLHSVFQRARNLSLSLESRGFRADKV